MIWNLFLGLLSAMKKQFYMHLSAQVNQLAQNEIAVSPKQCSLLLTVSVISIISYYIVISACR